MNRLKIIFSFFIFFLPLMALSQTFEWGSTHQRGNETGFDIDYFQDEEIFKLLSKYDLSSFRYDISAQQYTQDLYKGPSVDLGIGEPEFGAMSKTHLAAHRQSGADYVFFSTLYEGDTKEVHLYFQQVNARTGEKTEFVKLSSVAGKGVMNTGSFQTAMSPDGQYFAVLKIPAFYKKTPESAVLELYDSSLNKVAEIEHQFDREAKRGPLYELHLSNEGNIYLSASVDLKKQKPYLDVFTWVRGDESLQKVSLKQPDDYQIVQTVPVFEDNAFFLVSTLTHEGSTTFGMRISMSNRYSGALVSGMLVSKFEGAELVYQNRTDFDGSVSNISIKEILPLSDSRYYVVMERMLEEKKTTGSELNPETYKESFSYLSNGFFIAMLDGSSGAVEWTYKIDTDEPNTNNDNGVLLSVLPIVRNENLVLLYNETRNIREGDSRVPLLVRFPMVEVVSPQGETLRKEALLNAGVGVYEKEDFDLSTDIILPVAADKYLVKAVYGRSFKLGYLTF